MAERVGTRAITNRMVVSPLNPLGNADRARDLFFSVLLYF